MRWPRPVGKLYVQRFFPPEAKAQLQAIVKDLADRVRPAHRQPDVDGAKTKASAKAKLATLKVGIGYPDTWRDYSTLEIVRGDALRQRRARGAVRLSVPPRQARAPGGSRRMVDRPADRQRAEPAGAERAEFSGGDSRAAVLRSRGRRGRPVRSDRRDHRSRDQPQLRRPGQPVRRDRPPRELVDAGAISRTSRPRRRKLVAQYNAYQPFPDLHVNGQQTLSENIADLAGLSAAYDAYRWLARASRRPRAAG